MLAGARNAPITLADGENILGREARTAVRSPRTASRAATRESPSTAANVYLEDLGSKNGTFLKGRSIKRRERLVDGDAIALGGVGLVFRMPSGDRSTRTWKRSRKAREAL